MQLTAIQVVVVVSASIVAATTDLWKFKVYNALTFPLLVSGLAYHAYTAGWEGISDSAFGVLFGFASLILFYILGGMGAGDVKLLAAIGAWLGMPMTLWVFVVSSILGGLYAAALIIIQGRKSIFESWVNLQIAWMRLTAIGQHLGQEDSVETVKQGGDIRRRAVPFAVMVLVGVLAVVFWPF